MFYLTSGILKKIILRINLNDKPIELRSKNEKKIDMQLIRSKNTIVVQISKIFFFEQEDTLAVELYDGATKDGNCSAFIDKSKWSWVNQKFFGKKTNYEICVHKNLSVGSVIILKEYSFENIIINEEIIERKDNEISYFKDVLKINKFFIIGHDKNYKSFLNYF